MARRLDTAMKSWIVALQLKATDQDNVLDMLAEGGGNGAGGAVGAGCGTGDLASITAGNNTTSMSSQTEKSGEPIFQVGKYFLFCIRSIVGNWFQQDRIFLYASLMPYSFYTSCISLYIIATPTHALLSFM